MYEQERMTQSTKLIPSLTVRNIIRGWRTIQIENTPQSKPIISGFSPTCLRNKANSTIAASQAHQYPPDT